MYLSVFEFLEARHNHPVIDVRSPGEFNKGHIPGAFNIPLFSDDERAVIGSVYKSRGKETAVIRSLEYTGPKMADYVRMAWEISNKTGSGRLLVYCWRGGMRSAGMAWLFNMAGIESNILKNGYKAYRNHVLSLYDKAEKFLILGGYTGTGKTEILQHIADHYQVVDLEKNAHHKGSAFGFFGETAQPTTEQFANVLADEWMRFDISKAIWMEDESKTIGSVYLPEELFYKIRNSTVIFIDMPKSIRISRLVNDYAGYDKTMLKTALDKIVKRLGPQNYKAACDALEKDDFEQVAEITLGYYDKTYLFGLAKRDPKSIHKVQVNTPDALINAEIVMDYYRKNIK
jgi:tRNA 2-selenouridine synthase